MVSQVTSGDEPLHSGALGRAIGGQQPSSETGGALWESYKMTSSRRSTGLHVSVFKLSETSVHEDDMRVRRHQNWQVCH